MIPNVSLTEGFTEELIYDYAEVARHTLARPLGRLIFNARKIMVGIESSRVARRESEIFRRDIFSIEGVDGSETNTNEFYRTRREHYYLEGVSRLVERTLDEGLGTDRFLGELVVLADT